MSTYPHTEKTRTSGKDQRLEFWAWNFIADRDTTLNIRYHRMEVYGLRIFHIPGGMPTYQIYVSTHESDPAPCNGKKKKNPHLYMHRILAKIEQTGLKQTSQRRFAGTIG